MTLPKGKPKRSNWRQRAVLAVIIAALGAKYLSIDGTDQFSGAIDYFRKGSGGQVPKTLPVCSKHPEYKNIMCDERSDYFSDFPDMCPISNSHLNGSLSDAIQNRGNIDFGPQKSWGMDFDNYDSKQPISFEQYYQRCETRALIEALECKDLETAASHLNKIANVDGVVINDESLLHYSARNGLQNIVKLVLDKAYLFSEPNKNGDTPLMLAIDNNHLEVARSLLNKMDNVDQRNVDGDTALHIVAKKGEGQIDILCKLLDKTRRISFPNNAGKTALALAKEHKHYRVIATLEHAMENRVSQSVEGVTLLHTAAYKGHLDDVVKILKDEPNLVHAVNKWGSTPVVEAIRMGHVDVAEKILDMMKDVDQMDLNGNTALHIAAYYGQLSIVQKLLLKAKLISEPNNLEQTPLMVAETYPRKDVAKSMRAAILSALNAAK